MRRIIPVTLALFTTCIGSSRSLAQPPQPPRGFLGVILDPEQAESRAVITQVAPESPAAKAGLKAGDVVTKIGDKEIKNADAFVEAVAGHKPGDKLSVHFLREGKEHDITTTLAERPDRRAEQPRPRLPRDVSNPLERPRGAFLGIQMQELTTDLKSRLKVEADKGVVITEVVPASAAAKAGLKPDDVVTSLGDKAVANPAELRRAIQEAGTGKEVTLKLARGNDQLEVKVLLGEAPPEALSRIPRGDIRLPNINLERIMPLLEGGTRVEELEKRIQELERRIQELEKKLEKK